MRVALSELEALRRAALVDPLTGLWNRRGLEDDLVQRLAVATRGGRTVTVVVGDLDGLKAINDQLGHAAGDEALRALAAALGVALRTTDTAYRIGGDEFVLLLPDTEADEVEVVMARVSAEAPAFSWGAASFPSDGIDGAALIELADQRMLEGRRDKRGLGPQTAGRESNGPRARAARRATAATLVVAGLLAGVGVGYAAESVGGAAPVVAVVEVLDAGPAGSGATKLSLLATAAVSSPARSSNPATAVSGSVETVGETGESTDTTGLLGAVGETAPEVRTPSVRVAGVDIVIPTPVSTEVAAELDRTVDVEPQPTGAEKERVSGKSGAERKTRR
ncbi:MAG TPA: GGDEF domain-containing protein [Acidimicrobiales bacterium]|nr:GGDEF domain-containing protein [Acidimicrobiales bacterium]